MAKKINKHLAKAIKIVGGTSAMARKLTEIYLEDCGCASPCQGCTITKQAIHQWREVPVERVLAVERATGGQVKKEQLRPDIYLPEKVA